MTLSVIFYSVLTLVVEAVGGVLLVSNQKFADRFQEFLLAVGAGFILALAFTELIPNSVKTLGESAALFLIIGYGTIHFFEHSVARHLHFGEEKHEQAMVSPFAGLGALAGLTVHALFDGVAIAAGFEFNFYVGVLVFIAVLLHKLPEGLTIASITLAAKKGKTLALLSSAGLGFATLTGAVITVMIGTADPRMVAYAFAISAGAATYVGASDLVPELNQSTRKIMPLVVLLGMIFFYFSGRMLEGLVGR